MGKLGDANDCSLLVGLATGKSSVSAAARQALIAIQGEGVSQAIVEQIEQAPKPLKISLIEVLTAPRARTQSRC